MKLLNTLADLLYPARCFVCGEISALDGGGVCADCLEKLPLSQRGYFFTAVAAGCYSPFRYSGGIADSLRTFKFHGAAARASGFATYMACAISAAKLEYDIITWVPVSPMRKLERGYDQCELLCRRIAALRGEKPMRTLSKLRNNPAQSSLEDASRRKTNVSGAYSLARHADLREKRVLLIDDIVTTGATLSEAAAVLISSGASSVMCVTAAKA